MITERPVHTELRGMLLDNEPFVYAHLVKFERPSRPDASGRTSTSKERYTYLTDASRDVNFDDGTTNLQNVPNGTQVYVANKVIKLSGVSEQTEAKASNYSITLDGNGIGATASASVTVAVVNTSTFDVTWPASVDLLAAGFREGDKIALDLGGTVSHHNIQNFRSGNVLRLTKIDTTISAYTGFATMTLSSEEIKSILLDKNLPEYASFINREVFIYKAYFQEGKVVGAPLLLFKGIISNVSFEDTDSSIQVSWGLTSHWGDFAQVKGRITSDDFHRALDQNGIPQPQSALKPVYAYDKGFAHADTSINLLSTYTVKVEKQQVKAKSGILGIGSKVKVKKYFVDEARTTELDFQLQAKSIPVIYGVRNTTGNVVFADTLKTDSSTVYVIYALSEGEVGGIYDIYVNGSSLICNDKGDFDARSTQTADNTVEVICRGRADRGDVLGGAPSGSLISPVEFDPPGAMWRRFFSSILHTRAAQYIPPTVALADNLGKGVFDGESITLTSPQKITLDFFSGKSGQKASAQLVDLAKNNGFKIQNDYWAGDDTDEYWGPNHRLLDTAYVVAKYKIAEGDTTIPDLEFIMRGKALQCYNYDYSYLHYDKASTESANNFALGDMVTLYNMANVAISGEVQIIDKWTFANPDGTLNTRFRFSSSPALGYSNGVPSVTKFYMKNAAAQTWTMTTFNHEEFRGGVAQNLVTPLTSITDVGGKAALNYTSLSTITSANAKDPLETTPFVSLRGTNGKALTRNTFFNSNRVLAGTTATDVQLITKVPHAYVASEAAEAVAEGGVVVSRNTIRLTSAASATNDYYKGHDITVTRYDATTGKQLVKTATIVGYVGGNKIATIDDLWDIDFIPAVGDTVVITPKYADSRISINPAIQTLDYITSKTYGRGLDPIKDLNLPSWLNSARLCDTQSNVTVQTTSGTLPVQGHVYRYPTTGPLIWQGTVVGSDSGYVEFTSVIGKLTNAWNSWKAYKLDELVHVDSRLYKVTAAGVKTVKPTHTTGTVSGLLFIGTNELTLSSLNAGPTITLVVDGNPVRAFKDGAVIPGYSLYDSDGVDYWRLLGWDEHNQRYVTRHQTNLSIDTSLPLFDNINSLLEHFGGILRYTAGQYYLDVEEPSTPISAQDTEVRNITSDHIIGKINLSDAGIKSAFNSLTAAYADPANKFEARNITFFNSDYLKADRNVPKKGSVSVPGITNYYNTRILADKFLNKSRFGLTISFNMAPRGILLLAGTIIQLQYPRYGWVDKKFRISTITAQQDCTVDIVAEEYDDSFYVLSKISKQAASGLAGSAALTNIASPTNLIASSVDTGDETYSGVQISWANNPAVVNSKNVSTELYSSFSSMLYITVTQISGNVLTTAVPHELKVGELITSQVTINGLELGKSYYIKSIPSTTSFTISDNKDGIIKGLVNGTSLGAIMQTANLIANLPVPANSFVDVFGGINGRIVKYYWVRHKVVQG